MFFSVAVEMLNLKLRKAPGAPVPGGETIEQGIVGGR
jgi:hypothetical protein